MNISGRSKVVYKQEQIKRYLAFKPNVLANLLNSESLNPDVLKDLTKKYVDENPDIIRYINKPTGYMIAESVQYSESNDMDALLKREYQYDDCKDLKLLILVFCGTVNNLYIPNRNLTFESNKFNKILLFPIDEVIQ